MTQKLPIISPLSLCTALITALLAIALFVNLTPTNAFAARPTQNSVKTTTTKSIIRTNSLSQARSAIKAIGLRELRVTTLPGGGTLITVDTKVSGASAEALKQKLPDTSLKIYPAYQYKPLVEPNDPLYTNDSQWNLPIIDAPSGWDETTGSSDKTIAVIDSGVLFSQSWAGSTACPPLSPCAQPDFPDSKKWTNEGETGTTLQEGATPNCTSTGQPLDKSCNNLDDDSNGYIDDWQGWDFMGGWRGSSQVCPNFNSPTTYQSPGDLDYISYDNDPQPYSCDSPTHQSELNRDHFDGSCIAFESACYTSHGTTAASVAAAASNNNQQGAGVDWNAKIMNLRVLDGYGWGESSQITAAVEYATAMGADVINLSLAVFSDDDCTVTDPLLETALTNAKAAGVVVVAAAGNGGTAGVCYPGKSTNAIAVGATTSSDTRAGFSSYGPELDVMAPGQTITAGLAPNKSDNYDTYTTAANGTSFATPHVAGLASLLLTAHPTLTPTEVRDSLIQNTNKPTAMNGATRTDTYGYGRINVRNTLLQANNLGYVPLDTPRNMYISIATQKTDLLSETNTGGIIPKGRVARFETKVFLNGTWYLRSEGDTEQSNHLGIPISKLSDLPRYTPLDTPRSIRLNTNTRKTNLLTLSGTGETLSKGLSLRFTTKTFVNGTWYLRTEYDTSKQKHFGIPKSKLSL